MKKDVADIHKMYAEAKQELESLDKMERDGLRPNKPLRGGLYAPYSGPRDPKIHIKFKSRGEMVSLSGFFSASAARCRRGAGHQHPTFKTRCSPVAGGHSV